MSPSLAFFNESIHCFYSFDPDKKCPFFEGFYLVFLAPKSKKARYSGKNGPDIFCPVQCCFFSTSVYQGTINLRKMPVVIAVRIPVRFDDESFDPLHMLKCSEKKGI
jgi:hypothetical protein